jgi:UDP-N-acetylglucosamine--N-acetylmuramyl-(pentapeptide) pyrophosphoryl-undecaprenol N-acetylglucosamine transferase
MRLAVTGGGTGGHIYPALEVARHARSQGDEMVYLGSFRGQEGEACKREGVEFHGFNARPLYSLKTLRGWQSGVILLRAIGVAKKLLRSSKPAVLFSTGGYSAAPVLSASRSLKIPYVIFEANSIPGRTHRMFAPQAFAFASVFHKTAEQMPKVTRTGMPIRKALRDAAASLGPRERLVLVVGGSQGSAYLNESIPKAAEALEHVEFIHATGTKNYEAARLAQHPEGYGFVPYLEQDALVDAYSRASVAVARSGGTLAELALFRLPSVLVPLPTSADAHQLHNAKEFESMGAATLLSQSASSEAFATAIRSWLDADHSAAEAALLAWDVPDATERIYALIQAAGGRG